MMNAMKQTYKMTAAEEIAVGRAVLQQEIKGLEALSRSLDGHFAGAVDCIARLKGRIIISGMGKSGHVARKIAATFASTGTPASFVHPAEASHGDLGMITRDDGLLLLSNSGETNELRDLITYAKRFSIPLIAMVRRQGSMLVEAADIPLVLPNTPEASPTGAPTTSTTMMLALGDALAVALLEMRGFSVQDFNVFHPGGKLGQRFIRVQDLMHEGEELPLVPSGTPMSETLLVMTHRRFGAAGVSNADGTLAGIVTDGDLRRHLGPDMLSKTADDVMTKTPLTIRPGALAQEALAIMNEKSITTLFVCEENHPVGILHIHDCLRAGIV